MAFPKVGSRRISVDGVGYRWRIRRKATYTQAVFGNGRLHVSIQFAAEPGTTLILFTDRPHPQDYATTNVIPITPADIASWIRKSIALGWRPSGRTAPACFQIRGSELEKMVAMRPKGTSY